MAVTKGGRINARLRKSLRKRKTRRRHRRMRQRGGQVSESASIPVQVFTCWLGPWEMSEARKQCLESIKKNIDVKHIHITDENLKEYIKPEAPLHEGYQYLSGNHRSDYIRCYMMHHYGGGYTDVKQSSYAWTPYFKELEAAKDKWLLGSKEANESVVGFFLNKPEDEKLVKENWKMLVGNGAFIFRPNTPFTREWYAAVQAELDKHLDALRKNPSQKGINGSNITPGYPIEWVGLQGAIFHPLCVKYHDKIIQTLPPINTNNYR